VARKAVTKRPDQQALQQAAVGRAAGNPSCCSLVADEQPVILADLIRVSQQIQCF